MEGYVKLWRKIDENPIFKKPTYLSVFLWILLHVNFKANQFIWNNEKITIRRGELLTSADKIAQGTAIPRGTVERILKYLKNEEMIEEQTTKKFRLILVKNYEQYQSNEEQNEEQLRNKRGTTEEQVDTIKNVNNVKKDKNEKKVIVSEHSSQIQEMFKIFYEINPTINFGNITQRTAAEELIKRLGEEKALATARAAIAVHGEQYAPTITTPLQLKNRLSELVAFYKKKNFNQIII